MTTRGRILVRGAAAAALAVTLATAGCGDGRDHALLVGPGLHPVGDTPVRALETLRFAFERRDVDRCMASFAEDYRFAFSPFDSSGNAYREDGWQRIDEFIALQNLFIAGRGAEPPVDSLAFYLEQPRVEPDPRPGRDSTVHVRVTTDLYMTLWRPGDVIVVQGRALFFMTRGDSARVPAGLPADATRWYIDRIEDETWAGWAPFGAAAPRADPPPVERWSWGALRALYR